MIARLVFLVLLLAPRAASACAFCAASAYGDRTFNWAFLGLILMPFAVGSGIAAVFAARYYPYWRSHGRFRAPHGRFRAPHGRFRAPHGRFRASSSAAADAAQIAPHEESPL